ncbi:hypothetical protein V6617_10205 [Pelagibacterium nitratireducens]|uniref:Uncharacterized protein n=1 Tax=Pelagibacterium nitratireducens TaxID=1046114 RepID=A0ABZ2HUW0_9HYPH
MPTFGWLVKRTYLYVIIFMIGACTGIALLILFPGVAVPMPKPIDFPLTNLTAQLMMASAAWLAIPITAASVGIGLYSLFLIRENLIEARKISHEAVRSADAAEKAVAEAAIMAEVTETMGRKQVRAYLGVRNVVIAREMSLSDRERGIFLSCEVFNSGRTPARIASVTAKVTVMPRSAQNWVGPETAYFERTYPLSNIPADDTEQFDKELEGFHLSPECVAACELNGATFRAELAVHYTDVFGDRHENPDDTVEYHLHKSKPWTPPTKMNRTLIRYDRSQL